VVHPDAHCPKKFYDAWNILKRKTSMSFMMITIE
jgi:hypothetical protein